MNEKIIEILKTGKQERDIPRVVDELRQFEERELFRTLFNVSTRQQDFGTPVAMGAYAINQINPKCELPALEAFARLLPEWDISIEEVVFYLGKQFGRKASDAAIECLCLRDLDDESKTRLSTIRYWLDLLPDQLQREARMAVAARPPDSDEDEIRDFDRVRWMIRFYLRLPTKRVRIQDHGTNQIVYHDPVGEAWSLVIPKGGVEEGDRPFLYRYDGVLIGDDNIVVLRPLS